MDSELTFSVSVSASEYTCGPSFSDLHKTRKPSVFACSPLKVAFRRPTTSHVSIIIRMAD
jgi:hypothetical protein